MSLNINGRRAIGGSSMHNYSTDEHVVGTWIDGSTLYEKTYDLGSNTNVSNDSWQSSGITISGLSMIIDCKGTNSSGTFYDLMAYHTSGAINILSGRNGSGNVASVRWLTFQYTKSS